jgi:hypothetical protein
MAKDYQSELKDLYDTGITDRQIDEAKQKRKEISPSPKAKEYSVESTSSKKPEPTFKSDVDNMVSGVKKVDRKINDTLDPVRKVMAKAAGKEEPGILSKYSGLTKFVPEGKKKGGMIKKMATGGKVSQLAKANGIAVRGKSRGKIC